jgi:hypothetical protein
VQSTGTYRVVVDQSNDVCYPTDSSLHVRIPHVQLCYSASPISIAYVPRSRASL